MTSFRPGTPVSSKSSEARSDPAAFGGRFLAITTSSTLSARPGPRARHPRSFHQLHRHLLTDDPSQQVGQGRHQRHHAGRELGRPWARAAAAAASASPSWQEKLPSTGCSGAESCSARSRRAR